MTLTTKYATAAAALIMIATGHQAIVEHVTGKSPDRHVLYDTIRVVSMPVFFGIAHVLQHNQEHIAR